MKLEYNQFGGMRPAVDDRVLDRAEAIDALDCDLRYRTVKPFLAQDPTTLSSALRIPLGYLAEGLADDVGTPVSHLHDILHCEGGDIPEGVYEINERGTYVAASVVACDAHERVYFSRPDGEVYDGGVYDRGRTDGVGAFEERSVGVSAPVDPDIIDSPATAARTSPDPVAFVPSWSYYVENKSTGEQVAQGTIADAATSVVFTYDTNAINEPVYRYTYNKDIRASSGSGHVAYGGNGDTYDRSVYNFVMYAELASAEGRFLGTVYPEPSVREGDTDAYIGGTLADGVTHQGNWDIALGAIVYIEVTDLLAVPAGTEYSHYRSYLFTYVTDRGEESAPSAATDPIAVLPTYKVVLDIQVADRPDSAVAIRLYRTETTDSGTAFFFVEELDLPGTPNPDVVEYTDYIISVDLPGDTLQTVNWEPPPSDLKGLTLSTKGFYAGYVGSKLYLSEPFLAYAWLDDYAIDFTGGIRHIARYGDMLAVFTDREIALIVGNTPLEVRKIKVEGFELLTSIYSTAEMDGILYFSTPVGVAAVSGTNVAVVTDDLVSEQWWRNNIDEQEVRIVSFDNALYLLAEPNGQLYRVGLQEDGGGFVRLGDPNVRDVYTSSFFLGVLVLKTTEADDYVFNLGTAGDRTVSWRGRTEVADTPMAVISVRVLATAYPISVRFYGDGSLELSLTITSDKIRKLPVMRRTREWSFEVEGDANIVSLEVGTSGRVR